MVTSVGKRSLWKSLAFLVAIGAYSQVGSSLVVDGFTTTMYHSTARTKEIEPQVDVKGFMVASFPGSPHSKDWHFLSSLVPRPLPLFVLRFSFSIIHEPEERRKTWEHLSCE